MNLFDSKFSHRSEDREKQECCNNSIIKPACFPITIVALLVLLLFFMPMFNEDMKDFAVTNVKKYERTGICTDQCSWEIIESIPSEMNYTIGSPQHKSTYNAWVELLKVANKTVDITAVYWNIRDKMDYKTSWQGSEVFKQIENAALRGVKIRIAQNSAGQFGPLDDLEFLQKKGLVSVQILNFTKLFGSGILHSKLWIVDNQHFYLGSANMDWQSLTEVKELGILTKNCSCLAWEFNKIFSVYWRVGQEQKIPSVWPVSLQTKFNSNHPLQLRFNSSMPVNVFISHSPSALNPKGREHDLMAIIGLMNKANQKIKIAVMDYLPITLFMKENNTFWPAIDDAIRTAAFRGVHVQMLISIWPHSKKEAIPYLRSLLQINEALPKRGSISIKFFRVPVSPEQAKLKFARVNHNKYMVTDKAAWIGTSNWSGDYFITTAGIGMIIERLQNSSTIIGQLDEIFQRDWISNFSFPLTLP
uniref:PLD phosphodiesterase domain-containing protein n=1 Tax=Meloidogyne incognita TaxID=6306 RepID=A0A914L7L9_MELIC